ncbi:MAG TPA: GNAT family N-acetyltransferase [Tissierellia bacterium]|nr:GNAT family N-acetyltransferase [Tissierellia bacterium]
MRVSNICIDEKHRRQGIGTELMKHAKSRVATILLSNEDVEKREVRIVKILYLLKKEFRHYGQISQKSPLW